MLSFGKHFIATSGNVRLVGVVMDFELTPEQKMIVETATEIARDYGPEYWREKARKHEFP